MNKSTQRRVGGISKLKNTDPGTAKWLGGGAQNPRALTTKQKADRERVRARYDIAPELKAAIEHAARSENIDTSYTQFAEILLLVAMRQFLDGELDGIFTGLINTRTFSNSPRFRFDYHPLSEFERVLRYGAINGAINGAS